MAQKSLKPQFKVVAVRNAAAENNAHDDETEMRLSKAENRHAEVVRKIMSGVVIEGDLKKKVCEVAAYAMVRSPKNMRVMQQTMHESATRAWGNRNSWHASLLRKLDVRFFDIFGITRGEIASVMFEKNIHDFVEDYAKEFDGDNIQVLQAAEGNFVLADCPLSFYHPHEKKTEAGIIIPPCPILVLPLSNKIALEFYKEEPPHDNCQLNEAEIAEINRRSIIMADRFVYLCRKDESILEMIRKNANYSAGIENIRGRLGMSYVLPPDCDPTKVKVVSDYMPPPYQIKADGD